MKETEHGMDSLNKYGKMILDKMMELKCEYTLSLAEEKRLVPIIFTNQKLVEDYEKKIKSQERQKMKKTSDYKSIVLAEVELSKTVNTKVDKFISDLVLNNLK